MKKSVLLILTAFSALLLSSCGSIVPKEDNLSHQIDESFINEDGNLLEPMDVATNQEERGPEAEYNEGVVLVKTNNEVDYGSLNLDINAVEELYPNSLWHKITLNSGTSLDAVKYLRKTDLFDKVDYDYYMSATVTDEIDVSSNAYADQLFHLNSMGIQDAWNYTATHDLCPGGSPDVVVAVIDTGVDYNHADLINNIWNNIGEIPNNGIDDDNNGYVDDVRGWDCVNEDNDPIDDNGHGTHVAGIIAAENNNIGTVGVAFNCKIMPIKAGSHNGSFTNADIAQAIKYAYMNGASVINMSFGGASISMSVEEALQDAYYQCVMVAAAGNSSLCSQPGCPACMPYCGPSYPGCLPYLVGVMSCDSTCSYLSGFSNYDHAPFHYNNYEYDCYACGEQVVSTWPNNKYAKLSGTSMASPIVAGIAALMRSSYPDRDAYANKYILSQLTNTGPTNVTTITGRDTYHPVCNAYDSFSKIPQPSIYSVYRSYIFDNENLSINNNQDGFVNPGETIKLGVELQNRGGKATNITATIDTMANGDPDLVDPNVEILTDTIHLEEIGTFSTGDGGKIYDDDVVVDMTNAFLIRIEDFAQNDYVVEINLHLTYSNGLDETDTTIYSGSCSISFTISSGLRLSGYITEDTTFTASDRYIITDNLIIPNGITVTFTEGCKIVMYGDNNAYINATLDSPKIEVYGSLIIEGTAENMVDISVSSLWDDHVWFLYGKSDTSVISIKYANIERMMLNALERGHGVNSIEHCRLTFDRRYKDGPFILSGGSSRETNQSLYYDYVSDSLIDMRNPYGLYLNFSSVVNSIILCGNGTLNGETCVTVAQYAGGLYGTERMDCYCENNLFVGVHSGSLSGQFKISIAGKYIYDDHDWNNYFKNNSIITSFVPTSLSLAPGFKIANATEYGYKAPVCEDNYFDDIYRNYSSQMFNNNIDLNGNIIIDPSNIGNHDDSTIWPYIKDISIINSQNETVHTVGTERNTVRVTFSREMDISDDFSLFYGSSEPYADYKVQGEFISNTIWEGHMQVKAIIEGGKQFFSSKGGCAKDESFKELFDNAGAFTFNIDTSTAFAMNLQANPTEQGVELTWVQDDYDTLMGYNIYRSTEKDGYYSKLNSSIIPAGENTYFDDSCEPGRTYWYTFTVVLSDFSESAPAGKVTATPLDTIAPTIYHTPVNQGYENNNLVISCSASDNIAVTSVTLYYRAVGAVSWKSLTMTKDNNRYSAVIFGSEVTSGGLEYYISATDGRNVITRGSPENPYQVLVKDPSSLNTKGDVDGDGVITTRDALMIIQAINGDLLLTDDQFQRADLNRDGVLSSSEALRILQYINGKVASLDM